MGYSVTIQGGKPNGGQMELHQLREALSELHVKLQDAGHQMSTTFIKHPNLVTPRDEAHNFQDPNARAQMAQEKDNYMGVMKVASEEAQHMSVGAAQQGARAAGSMPVDEAGIGSAGPDADPRSSPHDEGPTPTSSDEGSTQTTVVNRNPSPQGNEKPIQSTSNVGPPQTPKVTDAGKASEPKPDVKPAGAPNPAPPSP